MSVKKIADHFMGIISEPDPVCIYFDKEKKSLGAYQMAWFYNKEANPDATRYNPRVYNCLRDLRNVESLEWVAQLGRFLNSRKDPQSDNPYADEIDVRGVMIDKILASHFLLSRYTGSLTNDNLTSSFLDIPGYREKLLKLYLSLLIDEVPVSIKAVTKDGIPFDYRARHSFWATHFVKPSVSGRVNRVLGLRSEKPFSDVIIEQLRRNIVDLRDKKSSAENLQLFRVSKNLTSTDLKGRKFTTMETSDGDKYYIFPGNILANSIHARWKVAGALEGIDKRLIGVLGETVASKLKKEEVEAKFKKSIADLKLKDPASEKALLDGAMTTYTFFSGRTDGAAMLQLNREKLLKSQIFYEDLMAHLYEGMR